jgi:NhaP-type Na+/H+ or K+/H+ antiporter
VTTDEVLLGVGLIVALAVGSQVLASRLKIPALILLLPAGFTAGAITTDVNPKRLLGATFQPLVSLAVAVILLGIGVGLAGGLVGVALLWLLLSKLRLGEVLGTSAQLASVVAVAAGCDIVREDSGLIAAIVMGLAVANLRGFDIPARRPFFETLVQLIIGVLFVAISATVTPASLRHLVLPTLGLAAVLVLITRPLVAWLATARTDMTTGERLFTGWMAPRGIIAAATASTFSAGLVAQHIGGAAKILPVTFLVIVVTVAVYGLTAVPVARRLGVTRPARTRPLLVGGDDWVIDLGRALRSRGLDVLMWAGFDEQRQRIKEAGLELAPGELLAAATGGAARLEGVTAVLLLTGEDDFNALGSTVLQGSVEGSIYRLGARQPGHGVVAPTPAGRRCSTRSSPGTSWSGVTPTARGSAYSPPTAGSAPTAPCSSWSGRTAGSPRSPGPARRNPSPGTP